MTFLSTDPKFSDSDNILLGKILQHLRDNPGGGGSGSQTPWASAINGGGFNLSNVATITATSVVSALTGNASTATVLQTARTINGVSFNGSADITLPAGNQTPWASDIDGAGFDLNDVTSIVATEVAANNVVVLDAGGGIGVQLQFAGATFRILDAFLDPKLTYDGALWDFVGVVEADGMSSNGQITATNKLQITQANINTAVFTSTGYSLTGSNATSLIDLAGTWNTSGNPVALKLAISNTASGATSKFLSFLAGAAGATEVFSVQKSGNITGALGLNLGVDMLMSAGAGQILLNSGSSTVTFFLGQNGGGQAIVSSTGHYGWSSTSSALGTEDLTLFRDAANTLALRNGVNAQTFNVYRTYTDASNYERLHISSADGAYFGILSQHAGTGSARALYFGTGSSLRWQINTSGHFLADSDNTYDIGASGATRPRNLYVAGTAMAPYLLAHQAGTPSAGVVLSSAADGIGMLANVAGSSFSRLQFGGTTSSFPSLKRSSTSLIARLADDSADAPFAASTGDFSGAVVVTRYVRTVTGTLAALPAASTAGAGARAFINDGSTTLILGLGLTAEGGGANNVPVYSDGTNWIVG